MTPVARNLADLSGAPLLDWERIDARLTQA